MLRGMVMGLEKSAEAIVGAPRTEGPNMMERG